MSLWLHEDGKEDFISEAGAMNVWIIKEAKDGCEWIGMTEMKRGVLTASSPRIRDDGS